MIDSSQLGELAAQCAYRIAAAQRVEWPYAHLVFGGVLPAELFESLRRLDVAKLNIDKHLRPASGPEKELQRSSLIVLPHTGDLPPPVAEAFALLSHHHVRTALMARFAPELTAEFGTADIPTEPILYIAEDRSGYELLPHTDVARKVVTLLIYLAEEGADAALGTDVYVPRQAEAKISPNAMDGGRMARQYFNRVTTIPYRPNQGLAFAPTMRSFHGVGEVPNKTRRILQFQLHTTMPRLRPAPTT